jgi:glycosyltransferase involved in cell wall biosynthesis
MRRIIDLPQQWWQERKRWSDVRFDGSARVYYGYEDLPQKNQFSSGGIVKCIDLQSLFPNEKHSPNVLYLVSSALPPHVGVLISMARRAGAVVVLNQNGVAYPGWHGPGWERTNEALGRVLHSADFVIYQSRFCWDAADRFLGPFAGSYEVLHNAVDTDVFTSVVRSAPVGRSLRLLVSGSHGQAYRVMVPLQMLAVLRKRGVDARLTIAGRFRWKPKEEDARKNVLQRIEELELAAVVDLKGAYTQDEAPKLMQDADLLVHAKYNDACPRLIAEALACGLPIVYSSSGGTPELVGNEAGIGIPAPVDFENYHPPDPAAMAEAVIRVAANLDQYGAAARRQAVERLSIGNWLHDHRRIFSNLVTR